MTAFLVVRETGLPWPIVSVWPDLGSAKADAKVGDGRLVRVGFDAEAVCGGLRGAVSVAEGVGRVVGREKGREATSEGEA